MTDYEAVPTIEPKLKTSWEIKKLRDSLDKNYDCCTLITNLPGFAKQLGISFGNSFKPSLVNHPGPLWWRLHPVVSVRHGPVVYADQVSKEIETLSKRNAWHSNSLY